MGKEELLNEIMEKHRKMMKKILIRTCLLSLIPVVLAIVALVLSHFGL